MGALDGLEKNIEKFGSIAVTLGLVLIILAKFGDSVSGTANTTINKIITAVATVGDYAGLIILILVVGVLMYLWKKKNRA
jgi:hypothetical protein